MHTIGVHRLCETITSNDPVLGILPWKPATSQSRRCSGNPLLTASTLYKALDGTQDKSLLPGQLRTARLPPGSRILTRSCCNMRPTQASGEPAGGEPAGRPSCPTRLPRRKSSLELASLCPPMWPVALLQWLHCDHSESSQSTGASQVDWHFMVSCSAPLQGVPHSSAVLESL